MTWDKRVVDVEFKSDSNLEDLQEIADALRECDFDVEECMSQSKFMVGEKGDADEQ